MTNRNLWKFSYTADRLLAAAMAKKTWHAGRLEWWTQKRDEVKESIRADGIEIDESVADGTEGYKFSSSHRAPSVNIRNDLVTDLNECTAKITEHRNRIKEYDSWVQVLESQGQSSLELNQADWLFFFGK